MMEQPPSSVTVKPDPDTMEYAHSEAPRSYRPVVLADLNLNPPEIDDNDHVNVSVPAPSPAPARLVIDESRQERSCILSKEAEAAEFECKKPNKIMKCRSRSKTEPFFLEYGAEADGDQCGQVTPSSREEKVSSLKTGLVHVARKMPKNAHAHFILGLMYQRLGQPQKAIQSYEKAAEILRGCEPEIARPDLLSLVQIHHAQCLLLESIGDSSLWKELEQKELEDILSKLKESMLSDIRQADVWNTLGLMLLKTGRVQGAVSVLSSLLTHVPENYDCLANLGIAYLQSGKLELSAKCFQNLVLKDQNHPTALSNYATFVLCKYGSIVAGAGANAGEGSALDQVEAVNGARDCLLSALRMDPKAAHTWVNLANAYHMDGDYRNSGKCLEKAAKLEPNCMSTRYAVVIHRIKEAERTQDANEQLTWAANEMASIIREGESAPIDSPIAWAGLAMVHKTRHEIRAAFETKELELKEVEDRAVRSLKQAITENPDDALHWHQYGLHCLCSRQFKMAQKYLKVAISRSMDSSYAWSNLGLALHLSEEPAEAEEVYKRALALATNSQAPSILSNLGNLYRQRKEYDRAKSMFSKSIEIKPGYASAYNNLGLVYVGEGEWGEAKFCFEKALEADPLLDAAKSNIIKATALSRLCTDVSSCNIRE